MENIQLSLDEDKDGSKYGQLTQKKMMEEGLIHPTGRMTTKFKEELKQLK